MKRYFDCKFSLGPFVEIFAGQRQSRNKRAETFEVRIISITKKDYEQYLIENFPRDQGNCSFQGKNDHLGIEKVTKLYISAADACVAYAV